MSVISDFEDMLPGRVLSEECEVAPYAMDASHLRGEKPCAVLLPENLEELSTIMKYCNFRQIPVFIRGGGTSLTGASVPMKGGVVISMMRFNSIRGIYPEDGYAEVEAGVRIDDINSALSKYGKLFPPDPGSSIAATLGGIINTNAGGMRCVRYGTTRDWILGVEAVFADGSILKLGNRTLKSRIGYDLTSLIVGSEGTLCAVTSAYIKLTGIEEKKGRLIAYFRDEATLGMAICSLKRSHLSPALSEYLDRNTMDALASSFGIIFEEGAKYMLMIDFEGTEGAVPGFLEECGEVMKQCGATGISTSSDEREMARLYTARKGAYSALLKKRSNEEEHVIIGDVVVPPSSIAETMLEIEKASVDKGLRVATFGHIGDGNLHVNMFVNLNDSEEMKRCDEFHRRIAGIVLARGGSVSAEHGIGLEKKELMRMEYETRSSTHALDIMKGIKQLLDPRGILNPGKVLD